MIAFPVTIFSVANGHMVPSQQLPKLIGGRGGKAVPAAEADEVRLQLPRVWPVGSARPEPGDPQSTALNWARKREPRHRRDHDFRAASSPLGAGEARPASRGIEIIESPFQLYVDPPDRALKYAAARVHLRIKVQLKVHTALSSNTAEMPFPRTHERSGMHASGAVLHDVTPRAQDQLGEAAQLVVQQEKKLPHQVQGGGLLKAFGRDLRELALVRTLCDRVVEIGAAGDRRHVGVVEDDLSGLHVQRPGQENLLIADAGGTRLDRPAQQHLLCRSGGLAGRVPEAAVPRHPPGAREAVPAELRTRRGGRCQRRLPGQAAAPEPLDPKHCKGSTPWEVELRRRWRSRKAHGPLARRRVL
jgi:hypothetical protein